MVRRDEWRNSVNASLARIEQALRRLEAAGKVEAMDLQGIADKVTNLSSVVDSGVVTLTELAALVRANAQDPAKMQEIADSLDAQATKLSEAIAANTPGAPPA